MQVPRRTYAAPQNYDEKGVEEQVRVRAHAPVIGLYRGELGEAQ
jgi:hypothetical protein